MSQIENYYSRKELFKAGFKKVGKNNRVSKKISMYSINGAIGSNVRIDDFVILKGKIHIGSNVHISSFCSISGTGGKVELSDFSGIGSSVQIYTASDSFAYPSLPGATLNKLSRIKYSKQIYGGVKIGKSCLIGPGSVILPKSIIRDFSSVGAKSLVNGNIIKSGYSFSNFGGNKIIKKRNLSKMKLILNKYYKKF